MGNFGLEVEDVEGAGQVSGGTQLRGYFFKAKDWAEAVGHLEGALQLEEQRQIDLAGPPLDPAEHTHAELEQAIAALAAEHAAVSRLPAGVGRDLQERALYRMLQRYAIALAAKKEA